MKLEDFQTKSASKNSNQSLGYKNKVLLISIFTLVIVIAFVLFTLTIGQRITQADRQWEEYNQHAATKAYALHNIQQHFGYGGFIHHFKNYILRRDNGLIPRIEVSLSETYRSLELYGSESLNAEEKRALRDIEKVIGQYSANFSLAKQLAAQGATSSDLDKQVKVDDMPAFEALEFLSQQVIAHTTEQRKETDRFLTETLDVFSLSWLILPLIISAAITMIVALRKIYSSNSKLQSASSLLKDVFESAPDAMLLVNKKGIVVSANTEAVLLLGYQQDDLLNMSVEELMPETFRHTHSLIRKNSFGNPKRRGLQGEKEFYVLNKEGEEIPVDISLNFTTHQEERYAITTLRDVSFRKQAEQELKTSRAMFSKAQKIAKFGSWDWDMATNKLFWSDEVYRIFGLTSSEFDATYDNFLERLHPADREEVVNAVNATVVFDQPYNIEHRIIRPNGEERIIHQQGEIFRGEDGEAGHMVGTIMDITKRKLAERELQIADNVFSHTSEAIMVTNADNKILRVNSAFTDITGYSSEEAISQNPRELLKSGEHDKLFYKQFWNLLKKVGYWEGEILDRRKNGEIYPSWHSITSAKDDKGEVIQYISIFSDITEEKKVREQLKNLAQFDQLTGLPNRVLFNDRLLHAVTRSNRSQKSVGLMFIDLDGFKGVNDTLGHHAGDQLLKVVAERLSSCVRAQDTVARLGGDEFTIILEDLAHAEDAAIVAEKLLVALSEPIHLDKDEVLVGGSIGIGIYPNDGANCEELIKHADMAMYQAKKEGRNRYIFYTDDIAQIARHRFQLEHKLRKAVEEEQLEVFYQPQIDWKLGIMTGAEALVRWNDPEKGLISPGEFIPLAEETGLIETIGNWVLEQACIHAKEWQQAGHSPIRVSVNVAGQQISESSIVATTKEALEKTGLDPQYLELEITESFVMSHPEQGISTINALRELGVSLAIDDFGTGHSSLSYLKQLSVHRLKIDRSFVMDIPQDKDDEAITLAIIAMAHSLGLSVIAEGVETTDHINFLVKHGCSEMQGFYFSPPLCKEEFEILFNMRFWRVKMDDEDIQLVSDDSEAKQN